MPGMRLSRRGRLLALLVVGLMAATVQPADAASRYYLQPGHGIYFDNGGTAAGGTYGHCTAGYALAGTDGTFVTSSRDCMVIAWAVRGTDRPFGFIAAANSTSLLFRMDLPAGWSTPPDDVLQIVVDPRTGRSPGDGQIESYVPTVEQVPGTAVAKMGDGTGWTEGVVTGWSTWRGARVICSTARTGPADAGGPVWRWDRYGLRAVGITVSYDPATGNGCYLPMEDVLSQWGAWLPVFPTVFASGRAYPGTPQTAPSLPQLPSTPYVAASASVPTR